MKQRERKINGITYRKIDGKINGKTKYSVKFM